MRDICFNKHGGNPESIEAYLTTPEEARRVMRERVLRLAVSRGLHGITADEAAVVFDCVHNHVAPRISELKADGRLVPIAQRRKTRAGKSARVLVAKSVLKT